MNIKILSEVNLANAAAECVAQVCPIGSIGIVYQNEERRRAIVKVLAEKGICAVYRTADGDPFPEHIRFAVVEGGRAERAAAKDCCILAVVSSDLTADLLNACSASNFLLCKEEVEARAPRLAVTGVKTLLLMLLSAADTALLSAADVSGEDAPAYRFLMDTAAFFCEPPVKQNYTQRLVNLLKQGAPLFKEPFSRLEALSASASESGFATLYFLLVFLYKSARLPFLSLLSVGASAQQSLYFLEECQDVVPDRVVAEKSLKEVARHIRLLTGKYTFLDEPVEKGFSLLLATVRESDRGFLSALKKEGILSAFVKYPL